MTGDDQVVNAFMREIGFMNMNPAPGSPTQAVRPRSGASWGISSLIIGILALLVCWIPVLNILAAPVGALGLLLGLISLIVAFRRHGIGIGFAIAGSAISALSLVVIFAVNGLIVGGMNAAAKTIIEADKRRLATNQVPVVAAPPMKAELKTSLKPADEVTGKPQSASTPTATSKPEEVWMPATAPVRQGNLQVRVEWVKVAKVRLHEEIGDGSGTSKESLLGIKIEMLNISQTKKVEYSTWAGADFTIDRDFATIEDNFGNKYKRVNFGLATKPVGRTERDSIYPAKTISDLLIFEPPINGVQYLNLELPAANFGGEGMIRLQIPASMISLIK